MEGGEDMESRDKFVSGLVIVLLVLFIVGDVVLELIGKYKLYYSITGSDFWSWFLLLFGD